MSVKVKNDGSDALIRLRLDVADRIVTSLIKDSDRVPTEKNLENANHIIAAVFAGSLPPTKVQFVQLLHPDLPKAPLSRVNPGLIRQARQRGRRAEKIAIAAGADGTDHPASELVYSWIAKDIVKADEERWRAEERLFSTNPNDWKDAKDSLTKV